MARPITLRENPVTQADPLRVLASAALAIPVSLPEAALERFRIYVDTLLLWRQRLSLTSANTAQAIVLDHLLDSLYIAPLLKPGVRVADIGSGAGFPGIPLAIACPEVDFTLVEPRRKRANFLREVGRQTGLRNLEVEEKRAEEIQARAGFDVVVARALGPVGELLVLAAPLLNPGGLAVAMKGPRGRHESTTHPSFATREVVEYILPNGAEHLLVIHRRLPCFT